MKRILCFILSALIMLVGCGANNNKVEDNAELIQTLEAENEDLKSQVTLKDKKIKELESLLKGKVVENNNLIISPQEAEYIINNKAAKIINLLKEKNMEEFATYIHPIKGVRFTPYTTVSLATDRVLSRESMKKFLKEQIKYLWGYYDGSGENILLKPNDYYERFIYDVDYVNAEIVSYNEVMTSNNNLENQFKIYPNSIIVEYYFSGFNPDYSGMDFKSLRIVFQKENDQWYVTGIIHNEWTI